MRRPGSQEPHCGSADPGAQRSDKMSIPFPGAVLFPVQGPFARMYASTSTLWRMSSTGQRGRSKGTCV